MKAASPLIALACALACSPAIAASAVESTFERLVTVCGELPDAQARVACFDREIAPFRARGKVPTASAPAVAPRADPTPPAARVPTPATTPAPAPLDFGAEQLPSRAGKSERDEAALTAKITAVRRIDVDASLVTLDNGQVWRNEDSRRTSYLHEGSAVTIRKGSFGSYRLTLDGGDPRAWISVTRVR